MEEITEQRIRTMWKGAWILQGLYFLLGMGINVWKGPVLRLFMTLDSQEVRPFTLWAQIACIVGTSILFLVIDLLLWLRLKEVKKLHRAAPEEVSGLGFRGLTWLLGGGCFLTLWLFPRMATGAVRETALRGLVDDSVDTVTYAAMTTLNGQAGVLTLLLVPAVILLFCGWVLLWHTSGDHRAS